MTVGATTSPSLWIIDPYFFEFPASVAMMKREKAVMARELAKHESAAVRYKEQLERMQALVEQSLARPRQRDLAEALVIASSSAGRPMSGSPTPEALPPKSPRSSSPVTPLGGFPEVPAAAGKNLGTEIAAALPVRPQGIRAHRPMSYVSSWLWGWGRVHALP